MKQNKGITLIALVITIIVLLILAGVAISMLSGENGILNQAATAKTETEKKSVEEQVKLAAIDALMRGDDLTSIEKVEELNEALKSQGLNITAKGDATTGYTVETEKIIYDVSKNGIVTEKIEPDIETISINTNCEKYYANLDNDEEPEGIIYIDKANTKSGAWQNNSNYSYSITNVTEANKLKEYYVSKKNHVGKFGTADVLTALDPTSTKEERFYVMALEDVKAKVDSSEFDTFCWYVNIYENGNGISEWDELTDVNIGKGKTNTAKMIESWNNKTYGDHYERDMWGFVENTWYIPSKEEWSAFASLFNIDSSNYNKTYGLSDTYWTSSLCGSEYAWYIVFNDYKIADRHTTFNEYVRLGVNF